MCIYIQFAKRPIRINGPYKDKKKQKTKQANVIKCERFCLDKRRDITIHFRNLYSKFCFFLHLFKKDLLVVLTTTDQHDYCLCL